MMTRLDAITVIGRHLKDQGWAGSGLRFAHELPGMLWLVDLEQIPRTERVGIYLGVCPKELAPDGWPTKANDCPILFIPEGPGEVFRLEDRRAWNALDMSSELQDEVRVDELRVVADAIVGLVLRVATLDSLKLMASAGLVAFVRRDAKELLGRST